RRCSSVLSFFPALVNSECLILQIAKPYRRLATFCTALPERPRPCSHSRAGRNEGVRLVGRKPTQGLPMLWSIFLRFCDKFPELVPASCLFSRRRNRNRKG